MSGEDLGKAFKLGLADAIGFVLGALSGWQLGRWFGYDFIASTAWGLPQLIGLALILLGCGLGRWLARKLILRA